MRIISILIILAVLLLAWGCAHIDPTVLESAEALPAGKLRVRVGGGLSQNYITGLEIPEDLLWDNDDALLPDGGIGFIARPKLKVGLGKNWEAALSGGFSFAPDSTMGFMDTDTNTAWQLKASAKKVWDLNPCHSLAAIPTLAYSDGTWESQQVSGFGHDQGQDVSGGVDPLVRQGGIVFYDLAKTDAAGNVFVAKDGLHARHI